MHGTLPQGCQLLMVPPDKVRSVWPQVRKYLEEANEATGRQFHETAALLDIGTHNIKLWIVVRGTDILMAMTTKLYKGSEGLLCYITCLGGREMRRWLELKPQLEAYAREAGCISLRLEGRNGWERALPDFERIGVIMEKRL